MKRTPLLNRHLSSLIASLGHLDEIIIADAGLPAPKGVDVIDLAIIPGLPAFFDVLRALKSELVIEAAICAEEAGTALVEKMKEEMDDWSEECRQPISFSKVSHLVFKERSVNAKAIIRTGETTPYANLILVSGVSF
ncbi:MAG: D-ribose pyranase [Sneathiella sp.]